MGPFRKHSQLRGGGQGHNCWGRRMGQREPGRALCCFVAPGADAQVLPHVAVGHVAGSGAAAPPEHPVPPVHGLHGGQALPCTGWPML